jgi:hypothetical protein
LERSDGGNKRGYEHISRRRSGIRWRCSILFLFLFKFFSLLFFSQRIVTRVSHMFSFKRDLLLLHLNRNFFDIEFHLGWLWGRRCLFGSFSIRREFDQYFSEEYVQKYQIVSQLGD